MISFLERHAGITDVQYFERPPCASRDIENWERAHYPCVLPEDFKSFLRLSDGLLLKWSIKQGDLTQPLGCMQVNDMANLSPCPRGSFAAGEGVFDTVGEQPPECVAAFELDSNALDGRLALLYRAEALTKPQIWFQDLSATWFFIAHTFTDYFRLMMMHLGNHAQPHSRGMDSDRDSTTNNLADVFLSLVLCRRAAMAVRVYTSGSRPIRRAVVPVPLP